MAIVVTSSSSRKSRQDTGHLYREDFDGGPVSMDEIEKGLFLGNLTSATNMETLKSHKITHILTLDSVPLPSHVQQVSFLTTKYVQISDMPKEDILHHLDQCTEFISLALDKGENILVHCYFGVSRSSTAVIAYMMKKHNLEYQQAFEIVKSKRKFVHPNSGFVNQLKLYRRMGCTIDPQFDKYKAYRLKLAGEQVRKAKILPQNFTNLIKPDPAITQENPEPIVYRCRKCRRVVASKSNVLLHSPKNGQPPQSQIDGAGTTNAPPATTTATQETPVAPTRLIDQIAEQIRRVSVFDRTNDPDAKCKSILFLEPIAWMKNISNNTQGRLNCPKCEQKLGNFSWINGCQCPCGEEVSPAFYLIASRVELTKAVQNVQTTV
ncbi:dual specificity protein phosphatase MPK-4 [Episyrphus balteatus]|uniref:dual specificity protein phosphatase MPK-4 n=1 Tax=Episyrphus balteatus TaxID=286459 RepID=UPI0024861811|nr:dual specificity protein phosphatase MPK-4 [Episyrphus balteatus]